jgi:hypothetical protein
MFDESREQIRKGYAAGRNAYHHAQDDRRVSIAMVAITLLGALLLELLAHYTTWSFVPRIAVSVAAVAVAQYLTARLFNQSSRGSFDS